MQVFLPLFSKVQRSLLSVCASCFSHIPIYPNFCRHFRGGGGQGEQGQPGGAPPEQPSKAALQGIPGSSPTAALESAPAPSKAVGPNPAPATSLGSAAACTAPMGTGCFPNTGGGQSLGTATAQCCGENVSQSGNHAKDTCCMTASSLYDSSHDSATIKTSPQCRN